MSTMKTAEGGERIKWQLSADFLLCWWDRQTRNQGNQGGASAISQLNFISLDFCNFTKLLSSGDQVDREINSLLPILAKYLLHFFPLKTLV